MTAFLIKYFIKDSQNVEDPNVRAAYGTLGSVTGVLMNLLLAGCKFAIGLISGSLAILADAANNLSDAAGSVVTFLTVRLAKKPVDPDHPFGHGRMEYLGSLAVGVLIVVMGFSLFKDAIGSIMQPEELNVSIPIALVLVISILGKLWMFLFYRKLGLATDNGTLMAASKDSLSDVLSTAAVLLSTLCCLFFGWRIDGWVGLLVSLIVLKAGYEVCKETVDQLVGGRPDAEKVTRLRKLLMEQDGIIGVHDLMMHDYGPGRCFASVHAEVDAKSDMVEIHEKIDDAERVILEKLHIPICIHMDPIVTDDEALNALHASLSEFLKEKDPVLSLHDLRMVPGEGHINVIFDCLTPAGYPGRPQLLKDLRAFAKTIDPRYIVVVTFDNDYT